MGSFLYRLLDRVLNFVGARMKYLAPLGRVLLFFAKLLRLNKILAWDDLVLIAKPYWVGDEKVRAYSLLGASLFCMVANAKAAYYFGYQLKVINDVVNKSSNEREFFLAVAWLAGIGAIWAIVGGGYGYFRSLLGLDWRVWQSRMYIGQYGKNEAYLRLKIENPDQRMAQDPDIFANTTVWLFMILVETGVNLYTFVPVLLQGSWILSAACVACALGSYIAVLGMGKELPKLTSRQLDAEASLRTHLQDGPRYAASIALQRSERVFLGQGFLRLGVVRTVLARVMRVNLFIGFYNFFSGKVVENAALVGIGWLIMHGRATIGDIAQVSQAFTNVYNGLTVFTSQIGAFSNLKAEIERLGPFARALDDIGENRMPAGQWIEYHETEGKALEFRDVTIFSSYLDAKPVVHAMTCSFDVDTLITGRDGHGKSDLARAIGLGVAAGAGEIFRPQRDKIMFLPQNLYLPVCSLRVFLLDMQEATKDDDERMINALDLVGLHDLPEQSKDENSGGFDTSQDWRGKLTTQQQQQLCLARAILFKPEVLVVDQATDGMEAAIEEDVFKILKALNVRLITFSNNARLAKYHQRVIELKEDGSYSESAAPDYKGPAWKPRLVRKVNDRR
ncbi:MAG: ATP-binding cassette domain-containing protein [Cyanobacteria bacterium REEB67]|nr:ATP-binding cassette domain-containing protein [Cyanobacteria bacterium REEB67]